TFNGVDTRQPQTAFTWEWGDGTRTSGFFRQTHVYADRTRNYTVRVTSHYADGSTDTAEQPVFFTPPRPLPLAVLPELAVRFPIAPVTLAPLRMPNYRLPGTLTFFDDSFFPVIPRATAESVLNAAAAIQRDFINN